MTQDEQQLAADVRAEVLMFKPDKVLLLNLLHDLLEMLAVDVHTRDGTIETLGARIRDIEERAEAARQRAAEEIYKKEEIIAAKDKELMQGALKRSELEETIKALEERLNTAAGMDMTLGPEREKKHRKMVHPQRDDEQILFTPGLTQAAAPDAQTLADFTKMKQKLKSLGCWLGSGYQSIKYAKAHDEINDEQYCKYLRLNKAPLLKSTFQSLWNRV